MKKYVLVLICFMHSCLMSAQHKNLDEIRNYYYSLDKAQLIDTLVRSNVESKNFKKSYSYEILHIPIDSLIQEINNDLANIHSSSIIMLVPILKNAGNYTYDKNIYDFLYVDTIETQIRRHDIRGGVETIFNCYEVVSYKYSRRELRDLKNALESIEKEKPEIWLLGSRTVFTDFNYRSGDKHYLYLKGDQVFVFRLKHKDIYELNHFVRKFFKEEEFKKRAIFLEEQRMPIFDIVGG
ncbi:hypothetical protein [Viscerimonas tarda]